MAWGPRSEGTASGGLLSLSSTLLAGAVVLVVVAAAVAFIPPGSLAGGGLVVTGPAADATTEPAEDTDERSELQVAVRGPRRLVPRHPAPLEVRVSDHGGALRLAGRRLLLTFDLELDPEARGWVMVDPGRLLVRADALGEQRIELRGFGELPCGEQVGTLHVTARELVEDGRTATAELTVPGQACDQPVPAAPDTVHQLEAPTPTPPARSTRPAPSSGDDGSATDDDPSSDSDPSDAEGDTEPDEAGDGDGAEPDDAVDGIVDTDGDDTSSDDETDDSDGDGGDAPSGDGSEGTQDSTSDDGGSDGDTGGTDGGDDEG